MNAYNFLKLISIPFALSKRKKKIISIASKIFNDKN